MSSVPADPSTAPPPTPDGTLSPPGARQRCRATDAARARRWDRGAVVALLLGAVVRVAWGLIAHPPVDFVYSDMRGYVSRAERLVAGAGLERIDAFWPPGTHLLLALPVWLFGGGRTGLWAGAVLWCALSCLVPFFAWRLARLLLTPAVAALTAGLCAFWPLSITYGGFFTSETPSLAFLLGGLWAGYRARRASGTTALAFGVAAGLLAGAAIAGRPQLALNLAVLVLPALPRLRRQAAALLGIAAATGVVLAGVVVHNSLAAGKPTALSENSALNFWMGHCNVQRVQTVDPRLGLTYRFALPVQIQLRRGGDYVYRGRLVWDQPFFYDLGLRCIRQDGLGHARLLGRSVIDMTATTVPWPQSGGAQGQRDLVQYSNLAYCLLLPWIAIESVALIRRRPAGWRSGEAAMLAQLACVVPVAVLIFGDPRVRSSYDAFGLALLAALVADRRGLDAPASHGRPRPTAADLGRARTPATSPAASRSAPRVARRAIRPTRAGSVGSVARRSAARRTGERARDRG